MGRPEKAYRLTPLAQEFFPSEHTNFTGPPRRRKSSTKSTRISARNFRRRSTAPPWKSGSAPSSRCASKRVT
jgi:hypothetical protein